MDRFQARKMFETLESRHRIEDLRIKRFDRLIGIADRDCRLLGLQSKLCDPYSECGNPFPIVVLSGGMAL